MRLDGIKRLDEGRSLNPSDIHDIEQKVTKNPSNCEDRVRLLGYYTRHSSSKQNHEKWLQNCLWLISKHAEHPSLFWPEAQLIGTFSEQRTQQLQSAWEKVLLTRKRDVDILSNAASFFSTIDPMQSIKLISEARAIEPDSTELADDCALYLSLVVNKVSTSEEDQFLLSLADNLLPKVSNELTVLETQLKLYLKQLSLPQVKEKALKILELKSSSHLAHTALGLVYLEEGAIIQAKEELIRSADSKSFYSSPFQFALAQKLLSAGEKNVVCQYLAKCWKVWPGGRQFLIIWTILIRFGLKPSMKVGF